MEKQLRLVRVIAIIVSLVAVAAFFLPFTIATEDYEEYLELFGDEKVFETADLTASEMKSVSLFNYAKIYFQAGEEMFNDKNAGIFYLVLIGGIGCFAAISCLWSLTKRPILLLLNTLLMSVFFNFTAWDFSDRIALNTIFKWGISYYMIYPCAALLAICSIWMFIVKRKIKKERLKMNATGTY